MKVHELKTDHGPFEAVWKKRKTFEIRKFDRPFWIGDHLVLKETSFTGNLMRDGAPLLYTGRQITAQVTDVVAGPVYGLAAGWCILSIVILSIP